MKALKRFKFRSFAERISAIKIDVIHRINRATDIQEDAESCFVEGLKKWRELNSTTDFNEFCMQARGLVQTFPQVVHHQDTLVNLLKQSLSSAAHIALQPLLDLTVQLARDLQTDFYPHFQDFVGILSGLVTGTDPEVVEDAFTCLAYLVKFLWRHLVRDIHDVYKSYCSLLSNSKKLHVRRFAAESFAFLLRKCDNQGHVVDCILQSLNCSSDDHHDMNEGVGVLLFETMKGVNQQFHSSAETFLSTLLLNAVTASCRLGCDEDKVAICLKKTMECMAEYCRQDSCAVVWQVLLRCLHQSCAQESATRAAQLRLLLQLLHVWISWRKGTRILHPASICKVFGDILPFAADVGNILMPVCASLFTVLPDWSVDVALPRLMQSIYQSALPAATLATFSLSLFPCEQFEKVALPLMLTWLDEIVQQGEENVETALCTLAAFTQHKRKHSSNPEFHISDCRQTKHLVSAVKSIVKRDMTSKCEKKELVSLWGALQSVCLLGLVSDMAATLATKRRQLLTLALDGSHEASDTLLFVLCELCLTLLQSRDPNFHWSDVIQLLHFCPQSVFTLQIAYQFVRTQGEPSQNRLLECSSLLLDNLTNPSQQVRLLSLKLLACLEENAGLFSVCLKIQEVPTTMAQYRDKLAFMHQLSYKAQVQVNQNDTYEEVGLRYLIGSLYLNFHPLWQPISELISTHASDSNSTLFWRVFSNQLRVASQQAAASQRSNTLTCIVDSELERLFFQWLDTQSKGCDDGRHDHANFRILLWKCMADVVQVVEQRSRDVTPVFLEFVHSEYFIADIGSSPTQNVLKEEVAVCNEGNAREEQTWTQSGVSRKEAFRTLSVMLVLFGKFHNPKAMYREPEMQQVFTTLLTHRDSEIQQKALDALMCYRSAYLMPYRENLNRLLREETVRDELVYFSLDEENSIVSPKHRKDLLPILVRILYGRMTSQLGGKAGKQGSTSRRGIVLRFFAGCPSDEFAVFMDIAMQPFKHVLESVVNVRDISVDPVAVVPLKKQQGFLSLLGQMFPLLGDRMEPHLPSTIRLLLYICHSCAHLLDATRQRISPHFITALRSLRQTSLRRLADVFQNYKNFDISKFKDDLFAAAVWPQLSRLKDECIQHPTALLSLLHVWSANSRDHALLDEPCPEEFKGSILGYVFSCLFSKDVSSLVVCRIFEMTDCLLTSRDERDELGVEMMKPHITALLSYLSSSVKSSVESSKTMPRLQLSVLSKLSEFVKDAAQSETLVELLLKCLTARNRLGKDEESDILVSAKNLLANVANTQSFLQPVSTLFYTLTHRQSRQALCDVFEVIAKSRSDLSSAAAILWQLNAWDKSRIEDVDFDSRLAGFTAANELVDEELLQCDCLLPLVSSSCHTLLHSDDMSLRDAASHFVRRVVERVGHAEDERHNTLMKAIIVQTVTPAVRVGLNASSEAVRHEHLAILSVLARSLSDRARFTDLTVLLNDNPEADFFENFSHIQTHRRVKALRELTVHITDGHFSASTLTVFLLPPVTKELFAATDHNVANEAVNVIGAAAGQYKWSLYLPLLRRYVRLLTRKPDIQKLVSKIVVAILNAFHFELAGVGVGNGEGHVTGVEESVDQLEKGMEIDAVDNEDGSASGLTARQAHKIHNMLVKQIIPELNDCLIKSSLGSHKLGHAARSDDQQDMMRLPAILAVVKLLQKLPIETLNSQLPGLVMRICQTLKSRSREVRDLARGTLVKVVSSLGPSYLPLVVSELRHMLSRGYQVHIMACSVHSIVSGLSDGLNAGDVDACVKNVVEISLDNLFGSPAEEREEGDLGSKIPEAKASHSYEMFELAAKFTSASQISCIVEPLRQVVLTSQTAKAIHCIEEALRRIGLGLQVNSTVSPPVMLHFIQDVLKHGIDQMQNKRVNADGETHERCARPMKPSLYSNQLLPGEPGRGGKRPQATEQATAHVLVAFGLQLLLSGVKRQTFDLSSPEQMELLDLILPVAISCLERQHNKVVSLSLRALSHIVAMKLPSFQTHVEQLMPRLFTLLRQYSRTGAAVTGGNQELSHACFKTMTAIIRNYTKHVVSDKDLKVLLAYVEEDLYDPMRQGTAFPLLKAILSRTLLTPMLHDVMGKVEELSVQSESSTVRLNCRQCVLQYVLDYPLRKKLQDHLDLFVRNLDYHTEDGRASVLEMLVMMFSRFPQRVMHRHSSYFFIPLMSRLFNDESRLCKNLVSGAIQTLLQKIAVQKRDELFALVLTWMRDSKVLHQRLASQACSLFVEVENAAFERRFSKLLPVVTQLLEDRCDFEDDADGLSDGELSNVDHLIFSLLSSLGKMCKACHLVRNPTHRDDMTRMWKCVERFLEHPHTWVQLAASRLFGLLFSCWKPNELTSSGELDESSCEYLQQNVNVKLSRLATAFVRQLESTYVTPEQGEQVVKNLLFLVELVGLMEVMAEECGGQEDGGNSGKVDGVTVSWMISQVSRVGRIEAGYTPHQTIKRTCVLKWLGALALKLKAQQVTLHLTDIMKPVIRELTDKSMSQGSECSLKPLAQEVSDLVKGLVGWEAFSRACATVQQEIAATRESRKRERALEAVVNPEKRAKTKMKKNLAKKESRKRKIKLMKHPAKWKKL